MNGSLEKRKILEKTAKEYFYSAEDESKKRRFNSAVVLYFKSLVALIDIHVFDKIGKTPSSHTERFRIVQTNFPEIYDILDKNFPFYQDSYVHLMTKALAEVIKDDIKIMAEKVQVKL